MGLTSQLIPTLVCLLACTSNFVHGHKCDITLQEIIKTLNILTARKVSKLSGTISPDALMMPVHFLDCAKNLTASRVGSWWLVTGWGAVGSLSSQGLSPAEGL